MAQLSHFHDYATIVTDIDRNRDGKRIVPMKLLCLGMNRTGTDSLRVALKMLGFNDVYHGWSAFFDNPKDCEMWKGAYEAKFQGRGVLYGRAEFDKITGHCQAVMDSPVHDFAEDFIAAYPEAKVILTNRPVEEWYRSYTNTLLHYRSSTYITALSFLSWLLHLHTRWVYRVYSLSEYYQFEGKPFEVNGKKVFEKHYDHMRSLVPADRLLELNVGDGWDPLCHFLGVERPDAPYPWTNEAQITKKRVQAAIEYTLWLIARRLFALSLGAFVGYFAVCEAWRRQGVLSALGTFLSDSFSCFIS